MSPRESPPSAEELRAFSLGLCEPARAAQIEAYLADGPDCTELLQASPEDDVVRHLRGAGELVPPEARRAEVPGYEILGELGRGGMGVVYRARHLKLNRIVALKMILAGSHAGVTAGVRFLAEAETVARLSHPNIVQVYEVGTHDGLPYLALEYVEGGSLARKTAGAPQPPRDAAALVELLARALEHAHQNGIIHRDVAPGNVLLTADGAPKLSDFGLARRIADVGGITATGAILGTLGYMAPEQAAADKAGLGPATDVYGLGAVLYALLTGRPPFQAANPVEVIRQTLDREPDRPSRLRPGLPRDLETICLKCLHKEVAKRYNSAAEMADDLRHFLADEPISARPIGVPERARRWARRHPAWATMLAVVASLVLVIIAGGGCMIWLLEGALKDRESALRASERARREMQLETLMGKAKARPNRLSPGQRHETLETIRQAVRLARELERPEETFADLRDLAVAALARPDLGPSSQTEDLPEGSSVVWVDPDKLLTYARADADGTLTVKRFADNSTVARLPGKGNPRGVLAAPDGGSFYVHDPKDGSFRHWRFGQDPVWMFDEVEGTLVGGGVSRDGQTALLVLSGDEGETWAEVRRLPAGALLFEHVPNENLNGKQFRWVALSPNGELLAVTESRFGDSERKMVSLYDPLTMNLKGQLPCGKEVTEPTWHPDSRILAVAERGTGVVQLWDTSSRTQLRLLRDLGSGEARLGFSQDGQMLCGAVEGPNKTGRTVYWNALSEQLLLRCDEYLPTVAAATDGRLFGLTPAGKGARLVVAEPSPVLRTFACVGRAGMILDRRMVAVHPKGQLLAVGTAQGVCLFDRLAGVQVAQIEIGMTPSVRFDSSGTLITSGAGGLNRWLIDYDTESGRVIVGPPRHLRPPAGDTYADVSLDGKVIAVPEIDRVWVWRDGGAKVPQTLGDGNLKRSNSVRVRPDGKWVAAHDSGSEATLVFSLDHYDWWLGDRHAPYFDPTGKWVTDGFRRWIIDEEEDEWEPGPPYKVSSQMSGLCGWTGDGRYSLRSRSDDKIQELWLVEEGRGVRLAVPGHAHVLFAEFVADGSAVVYPNVEKPGVHVWDLRELRRRLNEMGLDWEAPAYPPVAPPETPLIVEVRGAGFVFDRKAHDAYDKADAEAAVTRDDADADAHYRLGLYDLDAGDAKSAVEHFSKALKASPTHESALLWRSRALAHDSLKRYDLALADAQQLLELTQDDEATVTRLLIGEALFGLGKYEAAVEFLDRKQPLTWRELDLRAKCNEKRNNHDEAKADRDRADSFLTSPSARLQDAESLADGPLEMRDLTTAARLVGVALSLSPKDPNHLRVQGLVLYRQGCYLAAISRLKRSKEGRSRSDQGADLFLLAACHARLGEGPQARKWFEDGEQSAQEAKKAGNLSLAQQGALQSYRAEAKEAMEANRPEAK